jgi:hypothetical protein
MNSIYLKAATNKNNHLAPVTTRVNKKKNKFLNFYFTLINGMEYTVETLFSFRDFNQLVPIAPTIIYDWS